MSDKQTQVTNEVGGNETLGKALFQEIESDNSLKHLPVPEAVSKVTPEAQHLGRNEGPDEIKSR